MSVEALQKAKSEILEKSKDLRARLVKAQGVASQVGVEIRDLKRKIEAIEQPMLRAVERSIVIQGGA
jgi:hypothetical protein